MNWETQLIQFTSKEEWKESIELIQKKRNSQPNNKWVYIHAIYLFHHILLETEYIEGDQHKLKKLLKEFFNNSKIRFRNDGEYLFFTGKILHVAEWHFGLEDNNLAFDFQKKAFEIEPNNLLYKWAYLLTFSDNSKGDQLAYSIISNSYNKLNLLKNKGIPGNYILTLLNISSRRYQEITMEPE